MISFLEGKIILKKEKFIVLDVNSVGYKVFISQKTLSKLPEIGQNLKLFCFLNVRENGLELYGFLDEKELEFFELLDSIQGVGPKAALEISSLGPLEKLRERIVAQDGDILRGVQGIGQKKAQAIMLELSGKIKEFSKTKKTAEGAMGDEAEQALMSLGFSRQQVKTALQKLPKEIKETEQRVKEALKILGK